ncbi:MAG: hypothetical protein DSY82_01905 [Flavobacteriia bacterium]|nr:MAG: hypothetical protein DSY82_01905 [Flavobacteriia bacterium]
MKFLKNKKKIQKETKGTQCLNCGHKLSLEENFCPNCGQANDISRISLKHHFSEYLSGFFSFDNRFFKTIKPLLFKPGKVTREFIEGKRTKYVNPFQMYLHITIIFFLIIGLFNTIDKYEDVDQKAIVIKEQEKIQVIDSLKKEIASAKTKDSILIKKHQLDLNFSFGSDSDTLKKDIDKNSINEKLERFMKYDKEHKDYSIPKALNELGYKDSAWNIFYFNKAKDLNKFFSGDSDFIKSYANNFISKISIALFFLLPFFTLIVALFYLKSDYNYSEHLVFVFHVQTVFFIMLSILILFDRIFDTDFGMIVFFILFLFYLYKALRNFFKEGRLITFIKFLVLNLLYSIVAIAGLIIVAFIAFMI